MFKERLEWNRLKYIFDLHNSQKNRRLVIDWYTFAVRGYIKFKEKLHTKSIKYVYLLILLFYYDKMKNKDKNTPLFQAIPKS